MVVLIIDSPPLRRDVTDDHLPVLLAAPLLATKTRRLLAVGLSADLALVHYRFPFQFR